MAVRSGAGTGVIVGLVVFVLTTVFLLVLTIVFYAGKEDALEQSSKASAELAKYIKPQQRSSDTFKNLEQAASAEGKSVTGYLNDQYAALMRFVDGDESVSLEQVQAEFARFGVEENEIVRNELEKMQRDIRSRQVEIDGLKSRLADRESEVAAKETQIEQLKEDQKRELDLVSQEIITYRDAAQSYGNDVSETISKVNEAKDRLKDQYEDRIRDLENELDGVNREAVLLRARVDEYEDIFKRIRIRATSPDLLVDGKVIEVDPTNEQVYVDRGKRDRIVLGMTFEVYDDAASIRVNPNTGEMPRGKASLQVVKVGEATSTCKLTRTVPGRPVVRNNVVANAIYDPEYHFKFLVHGKFDVDGDGRPSEAEAEYLRSLVIDWGGEVVHGSELPGDLDFLVLGEMPPPPSDLRPGATEAQTRVWVSQRAARQQYEQLEQRASDAQIPVLNANRFFILIGRSDR
jgi:hypothetical protein